MAIGPGQFMIREACHTCMLRKQRGQLQTGGLVEIPRNSTYQSCFSLRATLYMYFYNYNYSYIYIYLHLPRCAKFQTLMRKTPPLPHEGQKNVQVLKSVLDPNSMPFIVDVLLSKGNMDQAATQKLTISSYMNFFIWDTPKVKKFI